MNPSTRPPPHRSIKVFVAWLARLPGNNEEKKPSRMQGARRKAFPAQKVFVLTIPLLTVGRNLRKARFLAWQHFGFGRDSKHFVSAEIMAGRSHHVLARTYDQKPTVKLVKALRAVGDKYGKSSKYSSICLLKIHPLIGLAIWAKARSGKDDLIVPVESCATGVRNGVPYRVEDILPQLQRSAQTLLDQSAALRSQVTDKKSLEYGG